MPVELGAAIPYIKQPPVLFELSRGFLDMGSLNAVRGRVVFGRGILNNSFDVDSGPSLYMLGLLLSELSMLGRAVLDTLGKRLHEAVSLVLRDHAFLQAIEGL